MGKLTGKPKSTTVQDSIELKAHAFVNEGGKSASSATLPKSGRGQVSSKSDPDDLVGITIKLLVKERDQINELRKIRSVRSKVSLHDWIIEAINEKLRRELE